MRSPPWYFTNSLAIRTCGILYGLYKGDPLKPEEREQYEEDLISFSDRELDLLGDIRDLSVLCAGGASLLWLEGLSERVGPDGSVTALEADPQRAQKGRELLEENALDAPVRVVTGDVFRPPFSPGAFDLVYSAGLLHELDVRERTAGDALAALASVVRVGGRVATSDFVDSVSAVQLEDEELQRDLAREVRGAELYGIGPPERLVALHEALLADVRRQVSPPFRVRHLEKIVLDEDEPEELQSLPRATRREFRERWEGFRERMRREGYTRPATIYVEGRVPAR